MFIGHFAVGFAAKKYAPRSTLGVLMAAPIFLDLLWPIFILIGLEQVRIDPGNTALNPLNYVSYPFSHSLVMAAAWATLFAWLYQGLTHYLAGTICIWPGVVSHWLLDAIVHRPDLPLYPGGKILVGLGLWNAPVAEVAVEGLLFVIGVAIYTTHTRPLDKAGVYGFWMFVGLLALLYVLSLVGPPPKSVTAVALVGLSGWLVVPWTLWFDRHRRPA